jgi:hypothetical protein
MDVIHAIMAAAVIAVSVMLPFVIGNAMASMAMHDPDRDRMDRAFDEWQKQFKDGES